LNGAGVGYLLLRERSDEFRGHRQIGKLHEIGLATVVGNRLILRGSCRTADESNSFACVTRCGGNDATRTSGARENAVIQIAQQTG
jgi:hypothetical protein